MPLEQRWGKKGIDGEMEINDMFCKQPRKLQDHANPSMHSMEELFACRWFWVQSLASPGWVEEKSCEILETLLACVDNTDVVISFSIRQLPTFLKKQFLSSPKGTGELNLQPLLPISTGNDSSPMSLPIPHPTLLVKESSSAKKKH